MHCCFNFQARMIPGLISSPWRERKLIILRPDNMIFRDALCGRRALSCLFFVRFVSQIRRYKMFLRKFMSLLHSSSLSKLKRRPISMFAAGFLDVVVNELCLFSSIFIRFIDPSNIRPFQKSMNYLSYFIIIAKSGRHSSCGILFSDTFLALPAPSPAIPRRKWMSFCLDPLSIQLRYTMVTQMWANVLFVSHSHVSGDWSSWKPTSLLLD